VGQLSTTVYRANTCPPRAKRAASMLHQQRSEPSEEQYFRIAWHVGPCVC
jgi:hypothetical protein